MMFNRYRKMRYVLLAIMAATMVLPGLSIGQVSGQLTPVALPVTLLDLCRKSDVIFEARFARNEDGGTVREEEDYSVVRMKKHFDVYSTLKGGNSKFFVLTEDEYRYPRNEQPAYLVASTQVIDEDVDATYGLKTGDSVLLFLRYGKDGKTLELADEDEGLKKLSSNDIAVYEKRIREIGPLVSGDEPSVPAIVEWMMRCAEEPATRWEATFELIKGFERLDWLRRHQTLENDPAKPGVIVVDKAGIFDSTTFARALTDDQKHRLADILLDRHAVEVGENGQAKRTYVRGDRELVDLVKHWGDPRLAGFLIDELKTKELNDYRRTETMRLIADLLADPKILGLADRYSSSYQAQAASEQTFDKQEAANTSAKTDAHHKQARAAIMAKFISLASSVVVPGNDQIN